ncbi:MAG: hypothetical protein PHQ24_09790 [Proteiniphilum sp.]|nr:hypothetical protein [Proteiniphilum sp.]
MWARLAQDIELIGSLRHCGFPGVFVGKMIFGVHADYEMEVVGHDAESEAICEIEFAQISDEIEEIVLFGVPKRAVLEMT